MSPDNSDTALILETIKEQGSRTEKSIDRLVDQIGDFMEAVTKSIYRRAGSGSSAMPMIAAIAGIMFGLMTPLYILMNGVARDVSHHGDLAAHSGTAAELATLKELLGKVETQSYDIKRRVSAGEEWQVWWQRSVPEMNATQNANIQFLWQEVFEVGRGEDARRQSQVGTTQ